MCNLPPISPALILPSWNLVKEERGRERVKEGDREGGGGGKGEKRERLENGREGESEVGGGV